MLASDVIKDVRGRLAETSEAFWLDIELLRYLDDAQKRVQIEYPHLEKIDDTTTSTKGVMKYDIPVDCQHDGIVAVTYLGRNLKPKSLEDLMNIYGEDWSTDEGTPMHYAIFAKKIFIVPLTQTTGDEIAIYYFYIPTIIDDLTDTMEVSDNYKSTLVKYTMQNAMYKHEEYEAGRLLEQDGEKISDLLKRPDKHSDDVRTIQSDEGQDICTMYEIS